MQVRVDVSVIDVDDEPARFERSWYRFDVTENQPGGTAVGRVSARDDDLPPFNSFLYRLDTTSLTGGRLRNNAAGQSPIIAVTGVTRIKNRGGHFWFYYTAR